MSAHSPDLALAPATAGTLPGLAFHAERRLGALVEFAAAALVLAEIAILLAGVLARYAFHHPLVWSDELASILFLWLSMLGAVVALRRGDHMRMTALVNRVSAPQRALLDTVAITASLALLLMLMAPAWEYAHEEAFIVTPALSTIGIVYAALVGLFIHRQFEWKRLLPMLAETASLTGAIIFIIGCATTMAWGLTQSGFSQDLARQMALIPGGSAGFLCVSIVAFIILGSVLEGIPAIVLFGPLLFPIARAAGVHEVHYAMVVIFAMGIGLFAPPFGVGYYGACAVSKVDPDEGIRFIWAYIGALLIGLLLVAFVPWFSIGFLTT